MQWMQVTNLRHVVVPECGAAAIVSRQPCCGGGGGGGQQCKCGILYSVVNRIVSTRGVPLPDKHMRL